MADDLHIFETLARHGVPFVVVGGHAVNFHGYIRVTEDADVVWLRSPESEAALHRALEELQARYIGNEIDSVTGIEKDYPVNLPFIQATHLMMLVTRLGFLDLFDYVPGLPDTPVERLLDSSVESGGLRYVSRDWLLAIKRASGRAKDIMDLENLSE